MAVLSERGVVANIALALPGVCFVAVFLSSASIATADEFADHVAATLQLGWRPTDAALEDAQARHAAATRLNARDAQADYALALVQMRHREWPAAAQTLNVANAKDPNNLYVWRTLVWLNVYQAEYAAALDAVQSLADSMPAAADDAAAEARWQAAAKIMGRVYGYLQGPRQQALGEEQLHLRRSRLLAKLGQGRQVAFESGEAEVLEQHQQNLDAIDSEKDRTLAANVQEKDEQRDFVDSEKSRIEASMAELQTLAAQAKEVLDRDLNKFDQELSPLRQSYASVLAQARPIQFRIRDLQNRISALLVEVRAHEGGKDDEEKNRNRERREQAQREADRLQFELRREESFLLPFIVESQRLEAAAAVIEQQKRAALARYQAAYATLDGQARKLQRGGRLLKASERELDRTASSTSGKIVDMRARLTLWPEYEKFPLEAERQRLLAKLQNE